MDTNEKLVEALAGSEMFQAYASAYNEATGMPLALRSVANWQLPFHGKQKENAFCALAAVKSHACAACLRLQGQLTQAAIESPVTKNCAYGLCETAVPVKFGAETVGFFQTGQVLRKKPTPASFRRVVLESQKSGVDLSDPEMMQAYFATPVASPKKLDSVTSLLVIFADHLAMKGNQLALKTANAEPVMITQAKRFIADHYAEEISLRQVARVVNVSFYYFCKRFRRVTGLSFTQFVSRTRIEKAKSLLLNPNLRVSEIAYAIGFQSLTHFNRAFKKIMGQSPTAYRQGGLIS